jgi:hypothetical protein
MWGKSARFLTCVEYCNHGEPCSPTSWIILVSACPTPCGVGCSCQLGVLASTEVRRWGRALLTRFLGHSGVHLPHTLWCGVFLSVGCSYICRIGANLAHPFLGSPLDSLVWITSTGLPIFLTFIKLIVYVIVLTIKSLWSRGR